MTISGKTYRIKSRARFMLFLALTIIICVMSLNALLGVDDASSMTKQEYIQVQVQSGDTLWNIAEQHMNDNLDIRKAVHMLCRINDISAEQLQPGQILMVPVN